MNIEKTQNKNVANEETSYEFLVRLRKKARDHKEELSYPEKLLLEVVDKSEEEAILGQGSGSKL